MVFLFASDLHGSLIGARRLLEAAKRHHPDMVFLLGDILHGSFDDKDEFCDTLTALGCPIMAVRGNCDYLSDESRLGFPLPEDATLPLFHKTFYLTHYPVRWRVRADVVLHGHTHVKSIGRVGDTLVVCPGSIAKPRDGEAGYGVIDEKGISLYSAEDFRELESAQF